MILLSSKRNNPLGIHLIYMLLKRIDIFMTVSHSVLENSIILHLFKACSMSFNKTLLFSFSSLVNFISRYCMGLGPIADGTFFSISLSVYGWNRKTDSFFLTEVYWHTMVHEIDFYVFILYTAASLSLILGFLFLFCFLIKASWIFLDVKYHLHMKRIVSFSISTL